MSVISNHNQPVSYSVPQVTTVTPVSTGVASIASVPKVSPIVSLAVDVVTISPVSSESNADSFSPDAYDRPSVAASSVDRLSPGAGESGTSIDPIAAEQDNSTDQEERSDSSEDTDRVQQQTEETSDANGAAQALERKLIAELSIRDTQVRAHEQAHKSVGGQYTGSVSLTYQTGPDGKRYAVGGEVPIDVSPVPGDPQATIAKMRAVKAAANAPADPSAQDRSVAAAATRLLVQAQLELSEQKSAEIADLSVGILSAGVRDRVEEAAKSYEEVKGLNDTDEDKYEAFA